MHRRSPDAYRRTEGMTTALRRWRYILWGSAVERERESTPKRSNKNLKRGRNRPTSSGLSSRMGMMDRLREDRPPSREISNMLSLRHNTTNSNSKPKSTSNGEKR